MSRGVTTKITPIKLKIGNGKYTGDLGQQFAQLADEFSWLMDQVGDGMTDVLALALEPTLELSQYYCPKDTGDLADSAYLEVEKFRGLPRVEIGYAAGGIPDYAIIVHEDPTPHHEPPTSYKFLQKAIDEDWPNIAARVYAGAAYLTGLK